MDGLKVIFSLFINNKNKKSETEEKLNKFIDEMDGFEFVNK